MTEDVTVPAPAIAEITISTPTISIADVSAPLGPTVAQIADVVVGPPGPQGPPGPEGGSTSFLPYNLIASTTPPPGTGNVGLDNVDPAAATVVRASLTSATGQSAQTSLFFVDAGDAVTLEWTTQTASIGYSVTGTPIQQGGYVDIPVAWVYGTAPPVGPVYLGIFRVGPQGPAGTDGADSTVPGPAGPQGPEGLVWRGDWDNMTPYAIDDAVTRSGGSFIALQDHIDRDPMANFGTFWGLLAMPGADGPQGVAGAQGPAGPQGLPGAGTSEITQLGMLTHFRGWTIGNLATANNTLYISYFTAAITKTITKLSCEVVVASSGTTYFRAGVYTVDSAGVSTRVAMTSLLTGVVDSTATTGMVLDTPVNLVPGQRYGVAVICSGGTQTSIRAANVPVIGFSNLFPRADGYIGGQASLPASIPVIGTNGFPPIWHLYD
jgi:hypothetical protein